MTEAKARRSSIRLFVQDPMNTASTFMSFIGVPGVRSMYCRARSAALRSFGSAICAGSGTAADSEPPWPGLVPQVTNGSSASASRYTSASKVASSSVGSVFQ